jgi:hypothetical protein
LVLRMDTRLPNTSSAQRRMSSKLSTAPSIRPSIGWNAEATCRLSGRCVQDRKREFKYYRPTAAGRKQLAFEESKWKQLASAIAQVLWPAEEA